MVAEHPEVRLEFLVDPLGLTIGLRMVGGGGRGLDPEKAIELLHEFRDEYGPPVVKPLEREVRAASRHAGSTAALPLRRKLSC